MDHFGSAFPQYNRILDETDRRDQTSVGVVDSYPTPVLRIALRCTDGQAHRADPEAGGDPGYDPASQRPLRPCASEIRSHPCLALRATRVHHLTTLCHPPNQRNGWNWIFVDFDILARLGASIHGQVSTLFLVRVWRTLKSRFRR